MNVKSQQKENMIYLQQNTMRTNIQTTSNHMRMMSLKKMKTNLMKDAWEAPLVDKRLIKVLAMDSEHNRTEFLAKTLC